MEVLPCLLLPLTGKNIILPTSAIAEILTYEQPKVIPDIPDWLIGILTWRGVHVPLVYLEKVESHLLWNHTVSSENPEEGVGSYIAIINRIYKNQADPDNEHENKYPFLAVVLNGVPKLYRVSKDNIKMLAQKREGDSHFMMEVKVQNNFALVPDLTNLWKVVDALPSRLQWFRQIII